MENFTPVSALIGGGLIGLSAVLLYLAHGRIAGVSGHLGGVLSGSGAPRWLSAAFLIGLAGGGAAVYYGIGLPEAVVPQASGWLLIAAGLLVGIGTRLGSGCTSGHGVCGLARLSPRSLVATGVFFTVALVTVFVLRHGLGGEG
jgi:uncharacterized membrane protein YedE/YeeE